MMSYPYSNTEHFTHPWIIVASMFWKRHSSPLVKHVLSIDVLERRIQPDGKLYTKQLIQKYFAKSLPGLLRRWLPTRTEYVIEESLIDPNTELMDSYTRNVGKLSEYTVIHEQCRYGPSPECYSQTQTLRNAWTTSDLKGRWERLKPYLSQFSISQYCNTAKKSYNNYKYIVEQASSGQCSQLIKPNMLALLKKRAADMMRNRMEKLKMKKDQAVTKKYVL